MTPAEAYREMERWQSQNVKGITASYRTVCFPEIPPRDAIEAYTRVDVREGWNAAADSVYHSEEDFALTFEYARFPVGVIVGVGPYPAFGTLPSTVAVGVLLREGAIEVLAGGVTAATAPYVPTDQENIVVARRGGDVVVRVGDWEYTAPGVAAGAPAQIRSMLYLAGDYVDSPRFIINTEGSARGKVGFRNRVPDVARARGGVGFRMAAKEARGNVGFVGRAVAVEDFHAKARGNAALGGVIGAPGGEGAMALPRLEVFGGLAGSTPRGSGSFSLEPLTITATGGYSVPDWAGGAMVLPGLILGGVFQVGEVGSGEALLPALTALGADYPYGQGLAHLPPLVMFGLAPTDPEGYVRMYEGVRFGSSLDGSGVLYAAIRSELEVGSTITFALLLETAMYDSLMLDDRMSFASALEVVLRSGIALSDQAVRGDWAKDNAHYAAVQYATNVLTGSVTRLEGFNFASFCTAGQTTYGVAPDGLYELGPYDDPIDAVVEFAAVGTESSAVKAMQYVYVGLATDGDVYVRVVGDDRDERVYRAVGNRDMFRAKCAGGVRARQWTVRLELVSATQATLDSVEWIAPATVRRFGR